MLKYKSEITLNMTNSSPINTATYSQLKEMLGEILPELKATFLEEAFILLEKMKEGLENDDRPAIFAAAHTLKSSAQNMGADTLAKYSLEMEVGTSLDLEQLDLEQLTLLQQNAFKEMEKVQLFLESID